MGNDRNDGLSPAKAWQSLDKVANESRNKKVRKNGFLRGDQVLFKRGLLYQSSGYPIVKVAGTAASPVRLGAYGDGAAPRFDSTGPGIYEVNLKVEGTRASVEDLSFVKQNAANVTETGLYLSGTGLRATRCDVSGVGIGVRLEGQDLRVDHWARPTMTRGRAMMPNPQLEMSHRDAEFTKNTAYRKTVAPNRFASEVKTSPTVS